MPAPPRYLSLDVTRGVAVMGILLVNIISFAMPGDAYIHPLAWGADRMIDLFVWGLQQILFDGRMRGLFALLFGASTLLILERSARPIPAHYARMAVLAAFGLAHGYLIWNGDILFHYAVLGCLLPFVREWSAQKLSHAAIILLTLHSLLMSFQFGSMLYFQSVVTAPGTSPELAAQFRAMIATFPQPGSASVATDLAAYRGAYADAVAYRWGPRGNTPWLLLQFAGGESLGYMLLGMALYRGGALTGGWTDKALKRLAVYGLAIGLPGVTALTLWAVASRFDPIVLMGNFLAWTIPFRVFSTLGWLAVILLIVRRFPHVPFVHRIGAAGRMAFTNYLATSVLMTAVFYGHGLNLFGRLGRVEIYAFVALMWVAILLWSPWWLARFRFGPMEWLWRSLSRGRLQPVAGAANDTQ